MAVQPGSLTLVQAAKEGDEAAFELLLEPLLDQGYRLACGFLHDHQAAEDAVQEAAIKAWRKLDRLRDGSEMRPWFLGIVANECRSTRRSRWWTVLRLDQPDAIQEPRDDTILEGVELRRALRAMDPGEASGAGAPLVPRPCRSTRLRSSPVPAFTALKADCCERHKS